MKQILISSIRIRITSFTQILTKFLGLIEFKLIFETIILSLQFHNLFVFFFELLINEGSTKVDIIS